MKPSIEQLAEIRQNAAHKECGFKASHFSHWDQMDDDAKGVAIIGMGAALAAYLDSIGEGIPHIDHCIAAYEDTADTLHNDPKKAQAIEAVRNLMLAAFAKKTAPMEAQMRYDNEAITRLQSVGYELEVAKARLAAVATLPEKWMQNGYFGTRRMAADDVIAALGSPPAVEPVPEAYADPYAELKAAWEAGRRIRCIHRAITSAWRKKEHDDPFRWDYPPSDYEIEPLPADPLAEVKGKLTDEQLGEIGVKAIRDQIPHSMIGSWKVSEGTGLLIFARAVAAEVRREYEADLDTAVKCHNQLTKVIEEAIEMVNTPGTTSANLPQSINAKIMERDSWHDKTIKRADAAEAEIRRLQSEYASLLQVYKKTDEDESHARKVYKEAKVEFAQAIATLRAENAKQAEEIAKHAWRPVSVKPTEQDSDFQGRIIKLQDGVAMFAMASNLVGASYWMPCPKLPAPTKEESERAEFETAWLACEHPNPSSVWDTRSAKEVSWNLWQAARASKEVQPLTKQEEQA